MTTYIFFRSYWPLSQNNTTEIKRKISNRRGSRTAATSKVKLFVIIVNDWKPLTIITKHSILGVAAASDSSYTVVVLETIDIKKDDWSIQLRITLAKIKSVFVLSPEMHPKKNINSSSLLIYSIQFIIFKFSLFKEFWQLLWKCTNTSWQTTSF